MLALLVSFALAKPADAAWMAKTATFTQADIVNARGVALAPAMVAALPETLDPLSSNVVLCDKQGLTQVEFLINEKAVYELQNGSEFSRRSALGNTHGQILAEIVKAAGGEGGGGYFGTITAPTSASEKAVSDFLKGREATDLVVTIGWKNKDGAFVYATLYSDRYDVNAEAPKAKK